MVSQPQDLTHQSRWAAAGPNFQPSGLTPLRGDPGSAAIPMDIARWLEAKHLSAPLNRRNDKFLGMWWPGTELNRRRQPFQTTNNKHFQQLTSRGRLPKC